MPAIPKPIKEKKQRKKPKAKSPVRRLIEEIDSINSINCLLQAELKCILCGGEANQVHHYYHKSSHGNVRFNPDNHCPICYACHIFKVHSRGEVEELRDNLLKKIGLERFELLKVLSNGIGDRNERHLREILLINEEELMSVVEKYSHVLGSLSEAQLKKIEKIKKRYLTKAES